MNELQEEQLKKLEGKWVIYAYTPLCGTCQVSKKMLQIVLEIEKIEQIGMVNVNYVTNHAVQWEIESVPCLLFIENGEVVEKLYAFQSVPFLLEKIRNFKKHSFA